MSTFVSMQSSCSSGIDMPGIATASMCGKHFSSTLRQLTPTIASILPVSTMAVTMAEPSAIRTA